MALPAAPEDPWRARAWQRRLRAVPRRRVRRHSLVGAVLLVIAASLATTAALATEARDPPGSSAGDPATSPTSDPATPPTSDPTTSPTAPSPTSGTSDDDPPVVRLARATWDTGWFQAEVHRQLLMRLGYAVDGPVTMENQEFFTAVSAGEIDLWANGWFPLHEPLLAEGAEPVGTQVDAGALQGYFVDLATAEEYGITSLDDLADPDLAALFDVDDNGLADLIGCNRAWTCGPIIDHHLAEFGLAETVEQVQADYSPLMQDLLDRYEAGEPVLFYTFTPNWTVGELVPGQDVRWLQVPGAALPDQPEAPDEATLVAGLDGCVDDPCQTGWPPNDIRSVANSAFLGANPSVGTLLEHVEIPLEDILAQNALMVEGTGAPSDIREQARAWLDDHAEVVDQWLATADPDAVPVTDDLVGDGASGEVLRVALRPLQPFVLYENRTWTGYSVELAEQLADRLDRQVEVYGVNSVAKQFDDLERDAADIAMAGISITADRERQVDFSLPVFRSGLGILVPSESGTGVLDRARTFASVIFRPELFLWVLGFTIVLLMAAHVIWWAEHRHNPDFEAVYGRGIWDSFWWSAVTIATVGYGDKVPTGNAGRSFALLWMIAGYFVFAAFTASITSTLAVSELRGTIAGPSDLPGHAVATVTNTEAEGWLIAEGIGPISHPTIEDAYAALDSGDVDAVVFDAPVLAYHTSREGAGAVRMVGPVFDEVQYGVAIDTDDDELREEVNLALLDMLESGALEVLEERWFGTLGG